MNSTDTIHYEEYAFDSPKYAKLQTQRILERIDKFAFGKLYLEVGGKFLFDSHAQRILPGFDPEVKVRIFKQLIDNAEILFCVDANAIQTNRQLKNIDESYLDVAMEMIKEIYNKLGIHPKIVINRVNPEHFEDIKPFETQLKKKGYEVYKRYLIKDYPENTKLILSKDGYGKDDYIKTEKNLIIVTGAASNSGKMSTCLGQIYLDHFNGIHSGYAKFETFPIWNLPLKHPINLAYEAATVDIGDYNVMDKYHQDAYKIAAVNYNRDEEAFEIIKSLSSKFVSDANYLRKYKSPTDMGINEAGFCITNDRIACLASLQEIRRRASWYKEILTRGNGKISWITRCKELEKKAIKYMVDHFGYNEDELLEH